MEEIKQKEKRSPKNIKIKYTTKTSYKYYKDNTEKKLRVDSYTEYKQIIDLFLKKFMERIVYNSEEMKMPLNLGMLSVVKKPFDAKNELYNLEHNIIDRMHIDWELSKKYKKMIPYTNEHTNYDKFKFHWSKKKSIIVNKTLYSFKPIRYWKRELARVIKTGKVDYFTL